VIIRLGLERRRETGLLHGGGERKMQSLPPLLQSRYSGGGGRDWAVLADAAACLGSNWLLLLLPSLSLSLSLSLGRSVGRSVWLDISRSVVAAECWPTLHRVVGTAF
jgi:hypothetical protein